MNGDLPQGWATARIADIATTQSGGTPSTAKREYWEGGDVPWINSGALKDTVIFSPSTFITKLGLENSSAKMFPRKTVVIALTGATTGRVGLLDLATSTNQSVTGIFPSLAFVPEYLFYYLRSARDAVLEQEMGSAQPHINKRIVDELQVPLAPLAEQRRIVANLEALVGQVDSSRQRLDKIRVLLKRFRQAVLAAACSGRLTEDWREERDLDDEWPIAVLREVAKLRLGKMLDKAKNVGEPTRYLRNTNVRWFAFDLGDLALMRATPEDRSELTIKHGDLLVCEGGEPGRCAVWNSGHTDLIFQKAIHRIRLIETASPQWLAFNIRNDANTARLEYYFTGTTIKHLTGKALAGYEFPLPPLAEQQEIVRRVESLFALADNIEQRYKKAQAFIDKLTPSLLAKAFRGELVPQDHNDEPASVLLERIKAEREKNKPQSRKKR